MLYNVTYLKKIFLILGKYFDFSISFHLNPILNINTCFIIQVLVLSDIVYTHIGRGCVCIYFVDSTPTWYATLVIFANRKTIA